MICNGQNCCKVLNGHYSGKYVEYEEIPQVPWELV